MNATTAGTVRCVGIDQATVDDGDAVVEDPPPHDDGEVRSLRDWAKTSTGIAVITVVSVVALIAITIVVSLVRYWWFVGRFASDDGGL